MSERACARKDPLDKEALANFVAQHVMGWERVFGSDGKAIWWSRNQTCKECYVWEWEPADRLEQAMLALDTLLDAGWKYNAGERHRVMLRHDKGGGFDDLYVHTFGTAVCAEADTLAEAICRAMRLAVGV